MPAHWWEPHRELRFLLGNIGDLPKGDVVAEAMHTPADSLDGWALGELARVQGEVRDAFARHALREAHLALFDFCNDTLSSVYCAAAKDRLYCDRADAPRRRRKPRHARAIHAQFRPARAAWVTVVRERDVAAKRFSLFVDSESGSP